jgi:thioredoxin 1
MTPRLWRQSFEEVDLMPSLRELSGRNFEAEVLQSPVPTLVDFWAPWCGPCRAVGPIMEQLAADRANSVKLAKLNVDESPDVAAAYGVHSIPTLIIFKDGKVVDRFVGVQPKAVLEHALDRVAA